jgi:hypothetical protein
MDSSCQPVLDATGKLFTTPYHMYMTESGGAFGSGKPVTTETLFSGGVQYILLDGKWNPSPLSTEQLKEMDKENLKNAKIMTCHYVRDESVNGESAALYTEHQETERAKTDGQVWVSRSKGLILRQDIDIDRGGAKDKIQIVTRYEYSNVKAPKL